MPLDLGLTCKPTPNGPPRAAAERLRPIGAVASSMLTASSSPCMHCEATPALDDLPVSSWTASRRLARAIRRRRGPGVAGSRWARSFGAEASSTDPAADDPWPRPSDRGRFLGGEQQPHVLGGAQQVDALARQPAEQQHAGIAGARHIGQVQDQGPPGSDTGIVQEGHRVVPEASSDADGREIGRLGHGQAERIPSSSPAKRPAPRSLEAVKRRGRLLATVRGKKHSRAVPCGSPRESCDTATRDGTGVGRATTGDGWPSHATGGGASRPDEGGRGVPSQPDPASAAESPDSAACWPTLGDARRVPDRRDRRPRSTPRSAGRPGSSTSITAWLAQGVPEGGPLSHVSPGGPGPGARRWRPSTLRSAFRGSRPAWATGPP